MYDWEGSYAGLLSHAYVHMVIVDKWLSRCITISVCASAMIEQFNVVVSASELR